MLFVQDKSETRKKGWGAVGSGVKHVRLDSEGGASLEEEIPFAEEGDADKVMENEAPQTKPRQSKVRISVKCISRL